MSSAPPGADLLPQLVHDIVALIRLRPGALLRLPTSPFWGLALARQGSALWIAISIAGCARIAAQRRPWLHACTYPDLARLAALLAARFPHAEPREAPGTFLFALDAESGACGRAVLLAQASAESFPWMVPGAPRPLAPDAAMDLVTEAQWRELGDFGGPAALDDLVSGGALPGADDPLNFFAGLAARFDRILLLGDDGRSQVRAALRLACTQERQRLAVLRRAWPAALAGNPYGEPPWLAPERVELEIDRALAGPGASVQGGGGDAVAGDPATPPANEAAPAAPRRRPSMVPGIRPAAALGAERRGPSDERSGA